MKKTATCLAGFLAFCLAAVSMAEPGAFRAGAARGNITPQLGQEIVGGFETFPATHVHDDLWVRCLALDDGQTRVAFAVCDLISLSADVSAMARRLVEDETGLPAGNILVSAVHTHSATSAQGDRNRFTESPEMSAYQKFVARRIADTVRCAVNNLAPARIGWATANEPRHVFNRRWHMRPGTVPTTPLGGTNDLVQTNPGACNPHLIKPAGPTDPEICLIAVQTREGRPIALFANYSLHYVGGVRGADISADYYGMFNDRIQQLLGADRQDPPFISILSNGTSGNINNIDFTKPAEKQPPYAKMRTVANDVARTAFEAYRKIRWRDHAELGASFEEIELKLRHPTPEQLEFAKNIFASPAGQAKATAAQLYFAHMTLALQAAPASWRFPLQAFRVGEVGIATMPAEVFCETGLEMKSRSPFMPTFVVSLAHGLDNYLPTPGQHLLGGYETWLGSSQLESEAEPKIVSRLLDMLVRLKSAK